MRTPIGFLLQSAVLFILLTLAGCASTGVVRNSSPISTGRPVSPDFVWVETKSSLGDVEGEKRLLSDQIISGLKETQLFGDVSDDRTAAGPGGGIKVKVDIKEIKKVSEAARSWVGSLAGRARILVQVTVTDLNAGNQIETFQAEGKSGGSAQAGTTDEAIQRAAGQVVAELVKISNQTTQ
jgi:hypothetical protein